jgi:hypothetical protein
VGNDDKVMSQADIDALLAKNAPKPKPRPAVQVPVASAPPPAKAPEPVKVPVPPPPLAAQAPAPPPAPIPPPKVQAPAAPRAQAPAPPTPPARPKPEVSLPRPVTTATYQKYSSGEVGALQNVMADLARQVAKLTGALQRIDQMEEQVNKIASMIKLTPEASKDYDDKIAQIQAVLDVLQAKSDTFRDDFQCRSCNAQNSIAIHVKCTSCGEENWMGWWPDGEKKQ